jgi:histidinol phosphatase-like enzyme (inositol monophosphatase family)
MGELEDLLRVARDAAALAGEVIMPLYASGVAVELKADRTPVTVADRRAEEAVRAFLARECPGHGILGEELGETPGDGRHRWIIDPIDGTKSFIHHVPLFGTLLALERDGEPVVGVIACHAVGETCYAAAGAGAFLDGQRIRVSTTSVFSEATVLATSFRDISRRHPGATERLAGAGLLRTWGDCYGYLAVAAGRAEAMLDPILNPWDIAALVPVITEAGGRITAWDGSGPARGSAIATNGALHGAVLDAVHGR